MIPTPDSSEPEDLADDWVDPDDTIDSEPSVGAGRSKAVASMAPICPSQVLARVSDQLSAAVQDLINDVRAHYVVPEGDQEPGNSMCIHCILLRHKPGAFRYELIYINFNQFQLNCGKFRGVDS